LHKANHKFCSNLPWCLSRIWRLHVSFCIPSQLIYETCN